MGRIARNLIASFHEQSQDLTLAADELTAGLPEDFPTPEQLAKEGYDPQHILYIAAQNFASVFAESVCNSDQFEEYSKKVERAEDEYQPSAPPISPITQSFFWTWALFDLQFGEDQETVGSCLLEVMRSMQAPQDMLLALEKYSNSRMGIYQHCGKRSDKVRLRELVTGDELLCHSSAGYHGRKNELWYVRLTPPLSDEFDYHVAVTTPYVLTEASAEDWTAFLNKHLLNAVDKRTALHELLKYGNDRVNWMEFVFQAYHHFQYDAVFLAGIPDVPASLPHSTENDETDEIANADEPNDTVVRVKLTEAQRKVIADICPGLSTRMRLSEKHQRVIEFRQSELTYVVSEARKALADTKGSRRVALKKIIANAEPTQALATAATIYQFKITLAGSKPPIWRRIQTEDCSLADFHYQIQGAMGWYNSHLHEFNIAGERYAAPPPFAMGPMDYDSIDASTVRLSQLIDGKKKFRCKYLYDFGDSWEHLIELEKLCAAEAKVRYPQCTDGARACPPEDCGGIWGFYDFVEAMADRKHPEHRDLKEWYGGTFKPDEFDKKKATREMLK